jgi:hypothetical protein
MMRAAPSGPVAGYSRRFEIDWGTIPVGTSGTFDDLRPFVPDGAAYEITPAHAFPPGVQGFGVQANVEGITAGAFQMQNNTAGPVFVGPAQYILTIWNPQVMQ